MKSEASSKSSDLARLKAKKLDPGHVSDREGGVKPGWRKSRASRKESSSVTPYASGIDPGHAEL